MKIKWPNDIYVDGKKLAGCICQIADMDDDETTKKVFIGIGLNLNNEQPTFSLNSYLKEKKKNIVEMETLLVRIIEEFEALTERLWHSNWKELSEDFYKIWEE